MRMTKLYASAALMALGAATVADAQSTTPGDQPAPAPAQGTRTTAYDAAFFAQYAPRSALDVARRVGLNTNRSNPGRRGSGFAGTAAMSS